MNSILPEVVIYYGPEFVLYIQFAVPLKSQSTLAYEHIAF